MIDIANIMSLKLKLNEYELKLDQSEKEIKNYKSSLQKIKDQLSLKKEQDDEYKKIIRDKNSEASRYLKEIEDTVRKYDSLKLENDNNILCLKKLRDDYENLRNEKRELEIVVQENDTLLRSLENDKQSLERKLNEALAKLEERNNLDEVVFDEIKEQIAEWTVKILLYLPKDVLETKEKEICRLIDENERLKNDMIKKNIELEEYGFNLQTIVEKDEKIKELSDALDDAYQDFEALGGTMVNIESQSRERISENGEINDLANKLRHQIKLNEDLESRCVQLETEIVHFRSMIYRYESGKYL
ncbi:hypothetical protein ROZALSC1DRAFT_25721 [Rozella allomycis CSF55]|uniref:Uncharacterized protein n=1 Tax=Rozella allomycis (strain CSF55) TaxID=988480 RepID=A0A4P9YAT8_ROZAC|nr:hypothetical protein ROZALSC1DRAFT_25721 [Rozella allomycis CSF55]